MARLCTSELIILVKLTIKINLLSLILTRPIETLNDTTEILKYHEIKTYYFNQKKSGCLKHDQYVTLINPILMVLTDLNFLLDTYYKFVRILTEELAI